MGDCNQNQQVLISSTCGRELRRPVSLVFLTNHLSMPGRTIVCLTVILQYSTPQQLALRSTSVFLPCLAETRQQKGLLFCASYLRSLLRGRAGAGRSMRSMSRAPCYLAQYNSVESPSRQCGVESIRIRSHTRQLLRIPNHLIGSKQVIRYQSGDSGSCVIQLYPELYTYITQYTESPDWKYLLAVVSQLRAADECSALDRS